MSDKAGRRLKSLAALLATVGIIGGCASQRHHPLESSIPPTMRLEARAEAYWARRQAKDLAGAYPFYCSTYRARVSEWEFRRMTRLIRIDVRDVRVSVARAQGDRAQVNVALHVPLPGTTETLVESRSLEWWVRQKNGEWCKEDESALLPLPLSQH